MFVFFGQVGRWEVGGYMLWQMEDGSKAPWELSPKVRFTGVSEENVHYLTQRVDTLCTFFLGGNCPFSLALTRTVCTCCWQVTGQVTYKVDKLYTTI